MHSLVYVHELHSMQTLTFDAVACFLQRPQIILLRDGTDTSQGKGQLISNINACCAVADVIRSTLGPCGMDKLIHDNGTVWQEPFT